MSSSDFPVRITDLIEIEGGSVKEAELIVEFTLVNSVVKLTLDEGDEGELQHLTLTLSRWPKIIWVRKVLSLKFGATEMWFTVTRMQYNIHGNQVIFAKLHS